MGFLANLCEKFSRMTHPKFDDIQALITVARERSFTRAAAQMRVSPSALSHTIRKLEEQLGTRLLNRTTRSVAPSEAGERLIQIVGQKFAEIDEGLKSLAQKSQSSAGTVRITMEDYALTSLVWPKLRWFLGQFPNIHIEIVTEYRLTDIVAERFDAGIRLGGIVDKDMIAVPIGPQERMAAVASPAYLSRQPAPKTPHDLLDHNCINLRLPTHGGIYAWEFEKDGSAFHVKVNGQLTFGHAAPIVQAALDGFGIGYVPWGMVAEPVARGQLVLLLKEWMPPFTGYHLYYPSRRLPTAAFAQLVEALRYRG